MKPTQKCIGALLVLCGLVLGISRSAESQERPRVANVPNQQRPRGQALRAEQLSPELELILKNWERSSGSIRTLQGAHKRFVYNTVFNVEKQSVGMLYYEAPDRGRLDFETIEFPENARNSKDMKLEGDHPQSWISTGKEIFQIDEKQKSYERIVIPPESQGQNITDGPLPFLFGMKAEKAKLRYRLQLGPLNGKEDGGKKTIHIIADPNWPQDAQNWKRAEVLLDAETYLPMAIQLIDPAGTTRTVYRFQGLEKNAKLRLPGLLGGDPFEPKLRGLKIVQRESAPQQLQTVSDRGTASPRATPQRRPDATPERPRATPERQPAPPDALVVPSLIGLSPAKAKGIVQARLGKCPIKWQLGAPANRPDEVHRVYRQSLTPQSPYTEGQTLILLCYDKMKTDTTPKR